MYGTVIIEGRRRRTWPTEFKKRVVMESCDPDVSVSEVARRNELGPAQLFAWRVNERSKLTRFQRLNLTHLLWRKAPSRAAHI